MNAKTKVVITLLVAFALLSGALIIIKHRSLPTVTVTLRISVTPADQVDFVTARANSAQFKYLVGKQSGTKIEGDVTNGNCGLHFTLTKQP